MVSACVGAGHDLIIPFASSTSHHMVTNDQMMAQTKQGPIHRLKLRRPPLATSVNAQCSSVTHSACCPLAVEIAIIYTGLGLG